MMSLADVLRLLFCQFELCLHFTPFLFKKGRPPQRWRSPYIERANRRLLSFLKRKANTPHMSPTHGNALSLAFGRLARPNAPPRQERHQDEALLFKKERPHSVGVSSVTSTCLSSPLSATSFMATSIFCTVSTY